MQETKKVLFVAYYFPPAGGSGVQRVLKFVKYLPEFGWQPVVLTARGADYPTLDPTLEAEVPPGVQVIRTWIVEPYALYRKLTGREAAQHLDVAVLSRGEGEQQKLAERFSEWVRRTFFIPDARAGWTPFATAAGLRVLADPEVRAVVSSAPPYTTHVIGLKLHTLTRKPWVADFRDSWVDWVSAPRRKGLPRRVDLTLEGLVLRKATRVVTVTRGVAEDLLSRHPEARDARWRLIPNGFDAADFAGVEPAPRDSRLTLIYTGSLYGARRPTTLLEAVRALAERSPEALSDLRLVFVGRIADALREELLAGPWAQAVEIHEYVPHRESVARLLAADVALLFIDDTPANKGIVTGKLFEYLGARRPVLAFAPPNGDAAELIRQLDAGWVVRPGDTASAARVLEEIYRRWKRKALRPLSAEKVRPFERRELTRKLAQLLDEVTGGTKAGEPASDGPDVGAAGR